LIEAIRKVGNINWIRSGNKLCAALSPEQRLFVDKYPVSRGLVAKMPTVQENLHVENKETIRVPHPLILVQKDM
jgi:hypothetical protein